MSQDSKSFLSTSNNNGKKDDEGEERRDRVRQTFCPVLPSDGTKWSRDNHYAYWSQWFSIPKTREDWTRFMIKSVRRKVKIDTLSDKDLEGIIRRAKAVLCVTPSEKEKLRKANMVKIDPDLPDFYYWTDKQVAEWIGSHGFPEVKSMFLVNKISGRKLINVDACALNQMGLRDLDRIRAVTRAVRSLLQVPAPNALRAILRMVPFQLYLQERSKLESDYATFKAYCENNGFDYNYLVSSDNKCNFQESFCTVEIQLPGGGEDDESFTDSEGSLICSPTVENVTRNLSQRDLLVDKVCDEILGLVMTKVISKAKDGDIGSNDEKISVVERVKKIFTERFGNLELELDDEKAEFIAAVANQLVDDILKTREILGNMDKFSSYMESEDELDSDFLEGVRKAGTELLGEIIPIVTLLSMGQLSLEVILRDAPQIQSFVQDLVAEAEDLSRWRTSVGSAVDILHDEKLEMAKDIQKNWDA